MADESLIGMAKRAWRDHRGLIVAGAGIFAIGIVLGVGGAWSIRHRGSPPQSAAVEASPQRPPAPAVEVPAVETPEPPPVPAAKPSEAPPSAADAPATETSPHTVVEEEPAAVAPPSPPAPAPTEDASRPAAPPALAGKPAWERFALPAPKTGGRPMIAVIIDDMGVDRRRSERILQLPGPLTISFMTYAQDLSHETEEARAHGHELMMHVPMEPLGAGIDPGPGALLDSLPPEEIRKRIVDDLGRFSGYVGINNHMGSKFTAYAPGMRIVMEELHRRGLLFIDSLTTDRSVGLALAQQTGIPSAGRNVFLDNAGDLMSVDLQLSKLEEVARKKGNAIAIGHPRDATIQALSAWLPTLVQKGFVLVPVTAVVKARMADAATVATH